MLVAYALLILAAICALLWLLSVRSPGRKPPGMPEGDIVYCGTKGPGWRVLHARDFHLAGVPDYVVKQGPDYIPVEVKSGRRPKKLYDSDRMQLTAQALLVEAEFGKRPAHGYVLYPDRAFDVQIRPKDIERLTEGLQIMREARQIGDIPDVRHLRFRCRACPRVGCPERSEWPRGGQSDA